MKKLIFYLLLFAAFFAKSQTYQPNWASLDQRPVPQWFKDSKFGIFIHWGVYSVPGFSAKGDYAEWYLNGLLNGDTTRLKFHKANYGDKSYYDFGNQFKASLQSKLWIADELVVNNEANGNQNRPFKIALKAGLHPIKLSYLQGLGDANLEVFVSSNDLIKQQIPFQWFYN